MATAAAERPPPVKDNDLLSLLDLARNLPKAEAKSKRVGRGKADQDYVKPRTAEVAQEFSDLLALGEITLPKGAEVPAKLSRLKRPALLALVEPADPYEKVAERATLKRLLKAKKVPVPDQCPTHELVWLVMQAGAFGRGNRRTSPKGE
jgi:hypothetical protein